uniref:ATP synthase F0 subunit 8 n=1 Tax=Marmota flaviventris TaxID=93162 RepID=UPI0010C4FE40|nr:ATP synthase F0 subunit 8 [Marmota flaviventris]QBR55162.1 ATP synthase F0 subunit 8 [Marmota flaviventris]
MPQLDTSTWFITILSMILALFFMLQLKISNHYYSSNPSSKDIKLVEHKTPWEEKWTKIYSPLSLPLH